MVRHVPNNAPDDPVVELLQKLATAERIASLAHTSDDYSSPSSDALHFSKAMDNAFDQPKAPDEFARKHASTYGAKVLAKGATGQKFTKFIPLTKIDLGKRQITGLVSAQIPDKDGEVLNYLASKPYFEAVIEELGKATQGENYFPLREMHQLRAVGKCVGFDFRDADREVHMSFEIVDNDAWEKVAKRVYSGFSIGGRYIGETVDDPEHPGCQLYTAAPVEVSLVDLPCLSAAHFTIVKLDGSFEQVAA